MSTLPAKEISLWKRSVTSPTFTRLQDDFHVDVAIVGGGIAGMTTAYALQQAGLRVAVVEKNTIASGTTGGTTGKVTSQHNLFYAELMERFGQKTAQIYAQANQRAVELIAKLIEKERIDCDWQTDNAFVFTTDPGMVSQYQREAEIAERLGLPAQLVNNTALPFEIAAAVKFSDQGKFNAAKYVHGLAKLVHDNGGYIFERSQVTVIKDGRRCRLKANGHTLSAGAIVVATKVPPAPLIGRFSYAALEYPQTSYIVAGSYDKPLKGMYISTDKHHASILPFVHEGEHLLLIGNENHIPGLGKPAVRHQRLADYAEQHFGIKHLQYRWKAMDYMAYDNIPLIGKLYPWSKHIFVANGFKKWGLSTSMVAAIILRDKILGRSNPWAKVFDSTRLSPVRYIPYAIKQSLGD